MELEKNRKQLAKLRLEIGKVLEGNSIYSEEDLAAALNTVKTKITEGEAILEKLRDEDAQKKAMCDNMIPAYQQFQSWAEEFENASLETKKMIACQLFTRVEIGKGYKVHMQYQQYSTTAAKMQDIKTPAYMVGYLHLFPLIGRMLLQFTK